MEKEEPVNLFSLLNCLLNCSEKACYIVQICRRDEELFQLLVEEKKDDEKNKRFVQDFKTLADVLVQETVRWEVGKQFPPVWPNIFGEENNDFRNVLGEAIKVKISDSVEDTINLLSKVLDGRESAALALADGIYTDVDIDEKSTAPALYLPANKIGIWIDPIDSTGEYVHVKDEIETNNDLVPSGLKCVCVLIGAYNIDTGYPVLGVVNQPFNLLKSKSEWKSKWYWGVCHNGFLETSIPEVVYTHPRKKIVVSSCEDARLLDILRLKYEIYFVAGAGYKCLVVARGDADLYVLSGPSTYFWDTCGPQAILMALGGSIIDFKTAITMENLNVDDLKDLQLKYSTESVTKPAFCNSNGIIAFRNSNTVLEFVQYVHNSSFVID